MGTVCSAHLASKVREYAPNAENRAVTVMVVENPGYGQSCVYCDAPNEFVVSFYPKQNSDDDPTKPDSSLRREMKERK